MPTCLTPVYYLRIQANVFYRVTKSSRGANSHNHGKPPRSASSSARKSSLPRCPFLDRVTLCPGWRPLKEGRYHTSTAAVLENLPRIARVETS